MALPITIAAGGATWTVADEYMYVGVLQNSVKAALNGFDPALWGFTFGDAANGGNYISDADDVVNYTGTTINTDAMTTNQGLSASVRYFFKSDQPYVVGMATYYNPTSQAVSVPLRVDSRVDPFPFSDDWIIYATSDGDTDKEHTDRWQVFSYTATPARGVVTTIRYGGHGGVESPPQQEMEFMPWQWDRSTVVIPAGQTRRVLSIVALSPDTTGAMNQLAFFENLPALRSMLLANGFTARELAEVVNFNFNDAPTVIAAAPGAGTDGFVKIYDADTRVWIATQQPYYGWTGEIRTAVGDINGDGYADVVTVPGPGGAPSVKAFSGKDNSLITQFLAYPSTMTYGMFVAAGDVTDDGWDDIIVAPDLGGGPHVKVFSGRTGNLVTDFYAYGAGFTGGVRVATGDINGDDFADIITAAGPTGGPHVKAFSGTNLAVLKSFFAFDPAFTSGIYVSTGDVTGDGKADIIVSQGGGGTAQVKVFDNVTNAVVRQFTAYASFTGAVRVAAADVNRDGIVDIITSPGVTGGPLLRIFDGVTAVEIYGFFVYDPTYTGGVYVGA